MDLIEQLIAGLALVVAVAAATYTRRQAAAADRAERHAEAAAAAAQRSADAAEETAKVERERNHRESTPNVRVESHDIPAQGGFGPQGFALHLSPPRAYAPASAELLDDPETVRSARHVLSVQTNQVAEPGGTIDIGPVRSGRPVIVAVRPTIDEGGAVGGVARLLLRLSDGGEREWTVEASLNLQREGRAYFA